MPPIWRMLQGCRRRGSAHVTTSQANLNLRTFANANGYGGGGDFTITIDAGVEIFSTSSGVSSLVTGSWPAGVTVSLVNLGTVSGAGGNAGNGYVVSVSAPTAGQAGGTALNATGVSGFTFSVDNTSGVLRGGGGGGCGGGGGPDGAGGYFAGGGGGGGRGRNDAGNTVGGSAGAGGGVDPNGFGAFNGTGGTPTAAGTGGAASTDGVYGVGYKGGDGGTWGAAGGAPSGAPVGDVNFDGPQSSAAAGHAVTGNANITWVATGTRIGTVS